MSSLAASLKKYRALPPVVWALFCVQGCVLIAVSMLVTAAALAGERIAPDPALATVPFAVQVGCVMLSSLPAAALMQRIGRKAGLMGGLFLGLLGAGLGSYALMYPDFTLLIVAHGLIGMMQGASNQLRFAAAEEVEDEARPAALSLVLTAGVIGALLGAPLAVIGQDLLGTAVFAGVFALLALLMLLGLILLMPLTLKPIPKADDPASTLTDLPAEKLLSRLWGVMRLPGYALAVTSGAVGYGVMTLLMTATPLAMAACGFVFDQSASVIQWHALAMFIPSFVTGTLIARFGARWIIRAGIGLNLLAVMVTLAGIELANFGIGLILLGLGWNFMFLGATTIAARIGEGRDRLLAQGSFDTLIYACSTLAAFASGALNAAFGWGAVNLGVAPLLMLAAIASFACAVPLAQAVSTKPAK
ncbi:MAG: MFS transporter [Alphaproteobacteria bacterium]